MAEGDFNIKAIISAQTSQFERGMKDVQKSLSGVSSSIQNVSTLLKSAFSVVGIGMSIKAIADFGASCVKSADSANKTFKILKNTIDITGATAWTSAEEMEKMSHEISDTTNYSVSEIQDMQSVLLGFKNITGDTFKEASNAITDMATVMGMDLKSAVQTVGKALDDPITGLDSLRRQGFAFTDEQKEQLKVLVENGEQMKAQKIILDELATTYGGAAQAGQSATARLNHAMDSFRETIGNKLLPIVEEFSNYTIKSLNKITDVLNSSEFDKITSVFINILKNVKSVFSQIIEFLDDIFSTIKDTFDSVDLSPLISVFDTILGSIVKIIDKIKIRLNEAVTTFKKVMNGVKEFLSNDLGNIAEYINAIIDGFWFLYDEVEAIITEVSDFVVDKIIWLWDKIKELFNNSNEALSNSEGNIKSWGDFLWYQLNNVFRSMQDFIYTIKALLNGDWEVAFEYAKLTVLRWGDQILTTISTVLNAFPSLVNGFIDAINGIIEGINTLREFIGNDPFDLIDPFSSVDLSEKTGLTKYIEETEKKITELTGKTADIAIKDLVGVSEKSKGFFSKLTSSITKTSKSAIENSDKIRKRLSGNLTALDEGTSSWFEKFKKDIEENAKDWSDVIDNIVDNLSSLTKDGIEQIGEALFTGEGDWSDYGASALTALAGVLEGIAGQLSAMAVASLMTENYKNAVIGFAGAVSALVVAGTLTAMANSITQVTDNIEESISSLDSFLKLLEEWKESISDINSLMTTQKNIFDSIIEIRKNLEQSLQDVLNSVSSDSFIEPLIAKYKVWAYSTELSEAYKAIAESAQQLNESYVDSVSTNRYVIEEYEDLFYAVDKLESVTAEYNQTLATLGETVANNSESYYQMLKLQEYTTLIYNSQLSALESLRASLYDDLLSTGTSIGETLVDSIIDGATEEEFLSEMKSYLKENIIKLAVYTESFNEKLANIGSELATALAGGSDLTAIRAELESLWTEASENAESAMKIIDEAFGDIADEISSSTDDVEDSLTRLEQMIENFKDEISDLGGEIATNLISGLADGLSQADFLQTMYDWIRKLIVQTVVYTESMKAEIEAIGQAISDGLSDGFSESSLHAIRRDLSYIFYSANKSMESIDSILDSVFSGYATGTNSATRGLHIVGEAGPELVRFKGGEQVYNARDTQDILSGGSKSNTFNVTFNNTTDTTAYRMISELKKYNREMAFDGIL